MVDKSTERGKMLSIRFFTIIMTVLTSTSFEVSRKIGMREKSLSYCNKLSEPPHDEL